MLRRKEEAEGLREGLGKAATASQRTGRESGRGAEGALARLLLFTYKYNNGQTTTVRPLLYYMLCVYFTHTFLLLIM